MKKKIYFWSLLMLLIFSIASLSATTNICYGWITHTEFIPEYNPFPPFNLINIIQIEFPTAEYPIFLQMKIPSTTDDEWIIVGETVTKNDGHYFFTEDVNADKTIIESFLLSHRPLEFRIISAVTNDVISDKFRWDGIITPEINIVYPK